MVTISQETKDRLSTLYAPKPPVSSDTNIGKKAKMNSGVYAGIEGIVYPKRYAVLYEVFEDDSTVGKLMVSDKLYLLLFFYDDGTLFCGVPFNPDEVTISGGYDTPVPGEGTSASPYPCGDYDISSGYGSQIMYHSLPAQKGKVTIRFDMYGMKDRMDVYFANNPTQLVASTDGFVSNVGMLQFYYDPAFNGSKVIVDMTGGGDGTAWEYMLSCPETI